MELDYNKLGQRIRKHRMAAHFTQEQLAEAVDVVPSSISRIETNANSCSLSLLVKIATALNVGIDALICDSLPSVIDLHLRKDFEALLSDCTTKELNLLIKVLEVTKKSIERIEPAIATDILQSAAILNLYRILSILCLYLCTKPLPACF